MLDIVVGKTVSLLALAIIVGLVARRWALPYTVGLVLTGIAIAFTRRDIGVELTETLIYHVILPPLLFEAALNISLAELRRDALPVLALAVGGTLASAAVVTAAMVVLLGWPLPSALLFGVLIAATDPVAVIAMFKDYRVEGRLRLLVESESLLNDGVAAVLFALVLANVLPNGHPATGVADVARALAVTVAGGVLVGLGCAAVAIALAGRTSDHLIESTLTTVAAYGAFLLADQVHCSGVLATVTAGLVLGNIPRAGEGGRWGAALSGHEFVLDLWEFIAFIANSLVFLLIGLAVGRVPFDRIGAGAFAVIIGAVLAGRALSVYPLCALFHRSRWAVPLREQHILWWGGLRGALALALALSLPPGLAFRSEILVATFAVVIFSVIVQGLTMPRLLRVP